MKKIAKACNVAFSMYSKIPMPRFEWASEDMRYHLFFFPWIGAVIGLLEWGWYCMREAFSIGSVLYLTMAIALPILVTGGFHLDGFMDTKDAQSSYQAQDKKLVILKDPHIGAFAVIHLVLYLLLAFGFLSVIEQKTAIASLCFSFFMSRCLSGWSVLHFPNKCSRTISPTSPVITSCSGIKQNSPSLYSHFGFVCTATAFLKYLVTSLILSLCPSSSLSHTIIDIV